MVSEITIRRADLAVSPGALSSLRDFYSPSADICEVSTESMELRIGNTVLGFWERSEPSFHHFALQVPGNRFRVAQAWLAEQGPLCARPAKKDPTFDFDNIDARASYVLDPAGNIVELIAFQNLDDVLRTGPFDPCELIGAAELGLVVTDRQAATTVLSAHGLQVWSGTAEPERLQFIGRRGCSIILASPGRGWLPTDRPAALAAASIELETSGRIVRFTLNDGNITDEPSRRDR
jgi:hypothetical protein